MKNGMMKSGWVLMLAMFTLQSAFSRSEIEGIWENRRNGITITVQETYDGIKVKRTDQRQWFYYDEKKQGVFEDRRGNKYIWDDYDELTWRERRNGKKIKFRKKDRQNYDDDWTLSRSDDWYDNYNDNGRYGGQGFYNRFEFLEGRWIHPTSNRVMNIWVGNKTLEIRRGWTKTTFRQVRRNRFEDYHGNKIKILDGNRVLFTNRNGYRSEIYSRDIGRRNNYCY